MVDSTASVHGCSFNFNGTVVVFLNDISFVFVCFCFVSTGEEWYLRMSNKLNKFVIKVWKNLIKIFKNEKNSIALLIVGH